MPECELPAPTTSEPSEDLEEESHWTEEQSLLSYPIELDLTQEAEADEQELDMLSPSDESDSNSDSWPETPKEDVFRFTMSSDSDNCPSCLTSRKPSYTYPFASCRTESSYGVQLQATNDFALDEDEDDLPPFDEWYQDIAQRTAGG